MKKYDGHGIELIFLENKGGEKGESSSPFQTTSDEDEGTLGDHIIFDIYKYSSSSLFLFSRYRNVVSLLL